MHTRAQLNRVWKEASTAELALLPLLAAGAGGGFACAGAYLFRLVFPEWGFSAWLSTLFLLAAIEGSVVAPFASALRLPVVVRVAELTGLLSVLNLVAMFVAPNPYTAEFVTLLSFVAWGTASLFGHWIGSLWPPPDPEALTAGAPVPEPSGPFLYHRLGSDALRARVYGEQRIASATRRATKLALLLVASLAAFTIAAQRQNPATVFGGSASAFAFWITGALTALCSLGLMGGMHGAATRRLWERSQVYVVNPQAVLIWTVVAATLTTGISVVAIVLPTDWSPVYRINWFYVMDSFTDWLGQFWKGVSFEPQYVDSRHLAPTSAMAPASVRGVSADWVAFTLLGTATLLFIAYVVVRMAVTVIQFLLREDLSYLPGAVRVLALVVRFLRGLWLGFIARLRRRPSADANQVPLQRPPNPGTRLDVRARTWLGIHSPEALIRLLFRRLVRLGKRVGAVRLPNETAAEYADSLKEKLPRSGQDIDAIAHAYMQVRYNPHPSLPQLRERAVIAWRTLRRQLGAPRGE